VIFDSPGNPAAQVGPPEREQEFAQFGPASGRREPGRGTLPHSRRRRRTDGDCARHPAEQLRAADAQPVPKRDSGGRRPRRTATAPVPRQTVFPVFPRAVRRKSRSPRNTPGNTPGSFPRRRTDVNCPSVILLRSLRRRSRAVRRSAVLSRHRYVAVRPCRHRGPARPGPGRLGPGAAEPWGIAHPFPAGAKRQAGRIHDGTPGRPHPGRGNLYGSWGYTKIDRRFLR
jgi:hypothetical protein